jgi:restriction endonuclease S subunit
VEIVKNMLLNASPSKVYELNNGEFITISDEDLILEILTSFPQDKIAAILSSLDQTLSSELTRKLVLPKN